MATPTEADMQAVATLLDKWEQDGGNIKAIIAEAITTARAEGLAIARRQAESMREESVNVVRKHGDQCTGFAKVFLRDAEKEIAALPLPDAELGEGLLEEVRKAVESVVIDLSMVEDGTDPSAWLGMAQDTLTELLAKLDARAQTKGK